MRRISINDLNDEMILAKPIYQGTRLILEKGMSELTKYKTQLTNLGILSLYVKDKVSKGIEIPDAVREETREKCQKSIAAVFQRLQEQGNFDPATLDEALQTLINDILSEDDIIASLHHISTVDDDTMVHCINTTVYSILIGKRKGLSKKELYFLAKGAILHDIGKIDLNESILLKNDSLTQEEYTHVKEHSSFGYNLLCQNGILPEESRLIALQHHERLDGSGYPSGLRGNAIHMYSQITAIADMYDALTSKRCYRKSMSNLKAYQILQEDASVGKINKRLVDCLFDHVAVYPNGIVVYLSDGTHGIVKEQVPGQPFRPIIRVIDDTQGIDHVILYDLNLSKNPEINIQE